MYDELIKNLRHDSASALQNCEFDFVYDWMLEAADAIERLNAFNLMWQEAAKMAHEAEPKWIPVTERLPESGTHVLAVCRTLFSNCGYLCDAFYAAPKSMEVSYYDDYPSDCETEYDEEEDKYFLVSGWYEVIKNWDDYNSIAIEDKVTHWMPLPQPPESDGE